MIDKAASWECPTWCAQALSDLLVLKLNKTNVRKCWKLHLLHLHWSDLL